MSEPMTPEREAELRLYCSLEMQDAFKEIDRLRASQVALSHAIQRVIEATGIKLTNPSVDLADELSNVMQAFICNRSNEVLTLTRQCQTTEARIEELEEALREIHEVAARAQCEPPPDTGALVNICTIAERTSAPLLDRHATQSGTDVAEQSRGGTK